MPSQTISEEQNDVSESLFDSRQSYPDVDNDLSSQLAPAEFTIGNAEAPLISREGLRK